MNFEFFSIISHTLILFLISYQVRSRNKLEVYPNSRYTRDIQLVAELHHLQIQLVHCHFVLMVIRKELLGLKIEQIHKLK
jgi:hypothetical protein